MAIKDNPLPDPRELVERTDWACLEHALGPAVSTPTVLLGLLASDPEAQAQALRHLDDPVHHQNTLYSATVPAALYVGASLGDPRTDTRLRGEGPARTYPLRASLLEWLGSVATEVGNGAEATTARLGLSLDEHPASVGIRAIRPALFQAVSALLHDPDPDVHAAAVAAAVPLLDAPELLGHRVDLAPLLRDLPTVSNSRTHRATAARGLEAWGEDVTAAQPMPDPPPRPMGCKSEPPF